MAAHSHPGFYGLPFGNMINTDHASQVQNAPSIFHQAHDFILHHPIIASGPLTIQNFDSGIPVLQRLFHSSISGTEMDSQARYPPPRCHPGTRISLVEKITTWLANEGRNWDMLWVYGPAGVGKSAVAQTIGERADGQNDLGAAFFFSKAGNRNDPSRVFVSISYQLAVRSETYKRLVAEQLAGDLGLLGKDMRTQFKKLIVEPLSRLTLPKKFLIIIDGLDECREDDAQSQIIDLISGAMQSSVPLPAIWMVCSRPEYHLKRTFSRADFEIHCWREELPIDDSEARRDIELYVRDGFKGIGDKYPVTVNQDGTWPSEGDVNKIIDAASGLFIYAFTILKFIQDPIFANPDSQLYAVITFIDNSSTAAGTTNPLYYLDQLYKRILSDVPPAALPTTLQLLGAHAFYPALPVMLLANLLKLSRGSFYAALHRLHSVVDVPTPENASRHPLHFFHASFADFLKDPARSEHFSLKQSDIHSQMAQSCLQVLGEARTLCARNLQWKSSSRDDPPDLAIAHRISVYAATNVWSACISCGEAGVPVLLELISDLDFRALQFLERKIPTDLVRDFIRWLDAKTRLHQHQNIVHTGPSVTWTDDYVQVTPSGPEGSAVGVSSLERYAIIGNGAKAAVVLLQKEHIIIA